MRDRMMTRRTGLVTSGGAPVTLLGDPVTVGDRAPNFRCDRPDGDGAAPITLADTPATTRLLSVVPSVDTSVCALQTVRFGREVAALRGRVAAYTVSVDTPYALQRFHDGEGLGAMSMISDYRPERSFGHAYGVLMEEDGELARAVFVVDAGGIVRHAALAADTWEHPDYDAALAVLRALAGG
jgi:thioredoxin-dependent peroxiredoxin